MFQNSKLFLRKGPGVSFFDYSQFISIVDPQTSMNHLPTISSFPIVHSLKPVEQNFVSPIHPCGSLLKLQIDSTWGSRSFVGLCHIEIMDPIGTLIDICPKNVHAFPSSLNVLYDNNGPVDIHTANRLIGVINPDESWIAPILVNGRNEEHSGMMNCLYILFDVPVIIGCIKVSVIVWYASQFWNYQKNPTCGIKSFSLWLDGNLLFSGELRKWSSTDSDGQSILFTDNQILIDQEDCNVRDVALTK